MPGTYFHRMFGEAARTLQARAGSRAAYDAREAAGPDGRDQVTEREHAFLAARDSLYMASVTEDGWPYVQHRGGPAGFVRSLGGTLIGFAEYPGNRQFISFGNIAGSGRVALFCMDYPARRRLKLIGHARVVSAATDADLVARVAGPAGPPAGAAVLIDVIGFDWNCPQHIEPRYTRAELDRLAAPLREENAKLRAELAHLRGEAP